MIARLGHLSLTLFLWMGLLIYVASWPTAHALEESHTKVTGVRLVPEDWAEQIGQVEQKVERSGWALSAEFDIALSYKLREAANRGLPLNFAVDFRLLEPRWYWTDKKLVDATYPITLSYIALTQTYRVVMQDKTLTVPTLDSAVAAMRRLQDWRVISRESIQLGQTYTAQVRFRLDVDELPKPFQISAFTSSQWILTSDWLEFEFTPRGEVIN